MYESPIKIIYGQMQTQLEGDILKAVMRTDIQVDKEELIHALRHDRNQYERGFADGYMNAQQELVRCKDCIHFDEKKALRPGGIWCEYWGTDPDPEDWCCKGERRTDERETD